MLKKVLIGFGVVFVLFILWSVYGLFIADPVSPLATENYSDQDIDISVAYSQPSKKGRVIFAEGEDALQPYGKYWRLGANQATEVTFSKNVTFAGEAVTAGTYRMYAVPGADEFKVILNSEVDIFFGAVEPNNELDILTVAIAVQEIAEVETLKFSFSSSESIINMDFSWDKTMIRIPITVQ